MLFTDWTQTDAHYFYLRGVIMGCMLTLIVIIPIIKTIAKKIARR